MYSCQSTDEVAAALAHEMGVNNTFFAPILWVEPTNKEAEEILEQITRIVEMEERQMDFADENKATFDKLKVAGMFPLATPRLP